MDKTSLSYKLFELISFATRDSTYERKWIGQWIDKVMTCSFDRSFINDMTMILKDNISVFFNEEHYTLDNCNCDIGRQYHSCDGRCSLKEDELLSKYLGDSYIIIIKTIEADDKEKERIRILKEKIEKDEEFKKTSHKLFQDINNYVNNGRDILESDDVQDLCQIRNILLKYCSQKDRIF